MIKPQKTLVMIVGHENPRYLIDTYNSIKHYNENKNYDVVFAIDFNKQAASVLKNKYGENHVFVSHVQNGWGRGILRTIIHALDYFKTRINYLDLITIDSDALCVGPFVDKMVEQIDSPEVFFVGAIWNSPGKDHGYHYNLRDSGFMMDYPFHFRTEMAAGPCMMWTSHCFKFLKGIGLMPGSEFDKKYPLIHFAHDQISTWLNSCGVCRIKNIGHIMEIKWRESLPTHNVQPWGDVPIIHNHTAIIHPTKSNRYTEDKCREYFRFKRGEQPPPEPVIEVNKESEQKWKEYFRRNNLKFNL